MNDAPDENKGFDGRMLEQRVARLEDDMKEVKSTLHRIEQRLAGIEGELKHLPKAVDFATLKGDIAEMKGRLGGMETRLSSFPTMLQMLMMLITTWSVGIGIVFAVLRFAPK